MRSWGLWIAFFAVMLTSSHVLGAPLRVVCRMGQPPFNDADSVNGTCSGLFADVFFMAMNATKLPYTLDILNVNSIDGMLSLDKNGNSVYDVGLSYLVETAARLALYDFSVALEQSSDCVALRPSFRKSSSTLTGAVIRSSVLYMFAVWSLIAVFMACVILVFEWLNPQSEMQTMPLWIRPLHAIEMGFEVVGTFSTSEPMESQITRSLRSVCAIMGFFVLTVFASAVTSQLTSSSLTSQSVTVRDIRGTKIAISSSTVTSYLAGFGVGVTPVLFNNINQFAADFYAGGHSDYDGYSHTCDIVTYLNQLYGGDKLGYVITDPYFRSGNGAYDLRAMAYSKGLNQTVRTILDTAFTDIRESGTLAALIQKYVPDAPATAGTDLPVDDTTYTVIKVVVGVLYGLMGLIVLILFVYHLIIACRLENTLPKNGTVPPTAVREGGDGHAHSREQYAMIWKHKKFKEIDDESRALVRYILRSQHPVEMSAEHHHRDDDEADGVQLTKSTPHNHDTTDVAEAAVDEPVRVLPSPQTRD